MTEILAVNLMQVFLLAFAVTCCILLLMLVCASHKIRKLQAEIDELRKETRV